MSDAKGMNHNTKRSLADLLRCIDKMNDAFHAYTPTDTDEQKREEYYHALCKAIGAVTGQASIVQIDLDIYEKGMSDD